MKKYKLLAPIILVTLLLQACASLEEIPVNRNIIREPGPRTEAVQVYKELPKLQEGNTLKDLVNLCNADLSAINLSDEGKYLENVLFDTGTVWPYDVPDGFNPKTLIDRGKAPGLDIESIQKDGYTGKNVGIAIIGDIPNVNHQEYKNRLVYYDEVRDFQYIKVETDAENPEDASYDPLIADQDATYKGTAACAAIAGKSLGTAPDADLYYVSTLLDKESKHYNDWPAEAVYRILKINETLESGKKIRLLIMDTDVAEGAELQKALDAAIGQGLFVIINNRIYGVKDNPYLLQSLRWDQKTSPEKNTAYHPGSELLINLFWTGGLNLRYNVILSPGISLTMASPSAPDGYCFATGELFDLSGYWLGGLYASACPAKPDLTPEMFLKAAYETGDSGKAVYRGKTETLERIVNPLNLFKYLEEKNK